MLAEASIRGEDVTEIASQWVHLRSPRPYSPNPIIVSFQGARAPLFSEGRLRMKHHVSTNPQ